MLAVDQLLQVLTARNGGLQFLLHLRQRFVLLRNGLLHLSVTKKERKKEREEMNELLSGFYLKRSNVCLHYRFLQLDGGVEPGNQ